VILENPSYTGQNIRLVMCHGANQAAGELERILGVSVESSPFAVALDDFRQLFERVP